MRYKDYAGFTASFWTYVNIALSQSTSSSSWHRLSVRTITPKRLNLRLP